MFLKQIKKLFKLLPHKMKLSQEMQKVLDDGEIVHTQKERISGLDIELITIKLWGKRHYIHLHEKKEISLNELMRWEVKYIYKKKYNIRSKLFDVCCKNNGVIMSSAPKYTRFEFLQEKQYNTVLEIIKDNHRGEAVEETCLLYKNIVISY